MTVPPHLPVAACSACTAPPTDTLSPQPPLEDVCDAVISYQYTFGLCPHLELAAPETLGIFLSDDSDEVS